jgi:hypothetical protein
MWANLHVRTIQRKARVSMKISLSCAALAVVLVASHASAQTKTDDIEQIKKELAALRAEVTALKEEVARLTKREEEAKATKLKALREEVARLTREEEEVKAAIQLADSIKAWTAARAEVTQRSPLSFIRSEGEAMGQQGKGGAIPVFSFTCLEERQHLAPDGMRKKGPGVPDREVGLFLGFRNGRALYRVSTWREGVLAKLPDPGAAFGLDLDGTGSGSPVTDAGLKGLAGLGSLQWLCLGSTPIGDVGLKELAGLKNLKWLDLRFTKVTDTGLKELAGLKKLQSLDLQGTLVTDAGVAALQKALPACKIQR